MNMHVDPATIAPSTKGRHRRPSGAKPSSPQAIIQMHLDAHQDKEAAIAAVIEAAEHNAALQEFLINKGARAAVGELIRSDNSKIFTGNPTANVTAPLRMTEAPLVNERHKQRLRTRADSILKLLDIMLPNGVMMANAKRDDIRNAIDHYEPQARDMLHKANYLKSVYRDMPDGKAVSDVFDDASLTDLFNKAKFTA